VKQAPSWDKVAKDYHGNSDVVFGDVLLSKAQVKTIGGVGQSPGAGGWPTIRHFNKATGYGGSAYTQKTSTAMCDELGPKNEYMQQYVEEAGSTSLCNVLQTDVGCSDKQKEFIEKWSGKPKEDLLKQRDRLLGMVDKQSGSMKAEALAWAKQRLNVFKQFTRDEL